MNDLKTWMEAQELSAQDVAKMCGVHMATVYRWLRGSQPEIGAIVKLDKLSGGRVTLKSFV